MSFPSQTTSNTCIQCDKSFLLETDLRRHQRKHPGGEKPFLCTECNKRFSQIGHLKRHERIHTGEKRFKCKECAKAFTQDVGLKIHTRMHTGESDIERFGDIITWNGKNTTQAYKGECSKIEGSADGLLTPGKLLHGDHFEIWAADVCRYLRVYQS